MTIAPARTHRPVPPRVVPVLEPSELLQIAEGLAATAQWWAGLGDRGARSWRTIVATESFEAFVIAWPPGGSIELHDHGDSAGAVVAAAGALVETAVAPGPEERPTAVVSRLTEGGHLVFGPGRVHDIVNRERGPALSVHVYSPVLRSMTFFDRAPHGGLLAVRTEEFRRDGLGR